MFCGCASVEKPSLETAISYQRDATTFAIPAIALSTIGLTTGVAAIEVPDNTPLRGISIACLGAGVLATVVAAVYGYLADEARERFREAQKSGTPKNLANR